MATLRWPANSAVHIFRRKVVAAKSDELTMDAPGQPSLKLKIEPSTKVMIDGRSASASELKEGSEVRAAYRKDADKAVAIKVEAKGESGASKGAPAKSPTDKEPPASLPGK